MAIIEGESTVFRIRLQSMGAALDTVEFHEDGDPFKITLEFPRRPQGQPDSVVRGGRLVVSALTCDGRTRQPIARVIAARALRFTDMLTPHLAALLGSSDFRLTVNVSDGGAPGELSLGRPRGDERPLFPDIYLLAARAPPTDPTWLEFKSEFMARKPVLFWRGSTTGSGRLTSRRALWNNPRVRACRTLRSLPIGMADCKISRIVQAEGFSLPRAELEMRVRGVSGPPVPETTFREHQMTIDLPGNHAAWGACLKYLGGCLVLRPPQSHELLYSARLAPWVHFIPVSADLADVEQRIAWVAAHQKEAATIAWEGRRLLSSIVRGVPATVAAIAERQRQCDVAGKECLHHDPAAHHEPARR